MLGTEFATGWSTPHEAALFTKPLTLNRFAQLPPTPIEQRVRYLYTNIGQDWWRVPGLGTFDLGIPSAPLPV